MSLYVCDNCDCIENTALGAYWSRNAPDVYPKEYQGKALCSECGPPFYINGTPTHFGVWHGKFEKESLSQYREKYPDSEVLGHPIPKPVKVLKDYVLNRKKNKIPL